VGVLICCHALQNACLCNLLHLPCTWLVLCRRLPMLRITLTLLLATPQFVVSTSMPCACRYQSLPTASLKGHRTGSG
jgi:hypothetical protein